MRIPCLTMAVLALGACGRETGDQPAPSPSTSAPVASGPAETPPPTPWSLQLSATAGAAITLSDARGAERIRIACRRNPADLYVSAPAFTKIGSEERLTLGAGDELATLVVSQETPAGQPLEATGQLPAAFVAAMDEGHPVAASYGATQLGPVDAPPPELRAAFAAACREAMAGR